MVHVNVMIHYQLWQQQHQYNIIISLYKDESADDEHVQQCYLFIFYLYLYFRNDFDSMESSHVHNSTCPPVNMSTMWGCLSKLDND